MKIIILTGIGFILWAIIGRIICYTCEFINRCLISIWIKRRYKIKLKNIVVIDTILTYATETAVKEIINRAKNEYNTVYNNEINISSIVGGLPLQRIMKWPIELEFILLLFDEMYVKIIEKYD